MTRRNDPRRPFHDSADQLPQYRAPRYRDAPVETDWPVGDPAGGNPAGAPFQDRPAGTRPADPRDGGRDGAATGVQADRLVRPAGRPGRPQGIGQPSPYQNRSVFPSNPGEIPATGIDAAGGGGPSRPAADPRQPPQPQPPQPQPQPAPRPPRHPGLHSSAGETPTRAPYQSRQRIAEASQRAGEPTGLGLAAQHYPAAPPLTKDKRGRVPINPAAVAAALHGDIRNPYPRDSGPHVQWAWGQDLLRQILAGDTDLGREQRPFLEGQGYRIHNGTVFWNRDGAWVDLDQWRPPAEAVMPPPFAEPRDDGMAPVPVAQVEQPELANSSAGPDRPADQDRPAAASPHETGPHETGPQETGPGAQPQSQAPTPERPSPARPVTAQDLRENPFAGVVPKPERPAGDNPPLQRHGYRFIPDADGPAGDDTQHGTWVDARGRPAAPGVLRQIVTADIRRRAEAEAWSAGRYLQELHEHRDGLPRAEQEEVEVAYALAPLIPLLGVVVVGAIVWHNMSKPAPDGSENDGATFPDFFSDIFPADAAPDAPDSDAETGPRPGGAAGGKPSPGEDRDADKAPRDFVPYDQWIETYPGDRDAEEPVTVYRVEGDQNRRVIVMPATGAVIITDTRPKPKAPAIKEGEQPNKEGEQPKPQAVHLNFGDPGRVLQYLGQKLRPSEKGTYLANVRVKSFTVPKSFADWIRYISLPEHYKAGETRPLDYKDRPQQVDQGGPDRSLTNDSFNVRPPQLPDLRRNIDPGSGRDRSPEGFMSEMEERAFDASTPETERRRIIEKMPENPTELLQRYRRNSP